MLNELRAGEVAELQKRVSTGKEQQKTVLHVNPQQACHAHLCHKDAEINTGREELSLPEGRCFAFGVGVTPRGRKGCQVEALRRQLLQVHSLLVRAKDTLKSEVLLTFQSDGRQRKG